MTRVTVALSAHVKAEIDEWLTRFPPEQKRSAVIPALSAVQQENGGHLTVELMDAVAAYLELPPIAVYEVATFYSMYNHKPVGRYILEFCNNISCLLMGANEVIQHCQNRLRVNIGETTANGRFTVRTVECLGACVAGPVCQVGDHYHEKLTPQKLDTLLDTWEETDGQ